MSSQTSELISLINQYASGADELRAVIGDVGDSDARTRIAPGHWSILEVVCHLSDFELVYADRLKRVVAEDKPTLFGGDPDQFAEKLAYGQRNLGEELDVIAAVRRQVTRFLRTLDAEAFDRVGVHSDDGPLTLVAFLKRITGHIPHHAEFIRQKRKALAGQ